MYLKKIFFVFMLLLPSTIAWSADGRTTGERKIIDYLQHPASKTREWYKTCKEKEKKEIERVRLLAEKEAGMLQPCKIKRRKKKIRLTDLPDNLLKHIMQYISDDDLKTLGVFSSLCYSTHQVAHKRLCEKMRKWNADMYHKGSHTCQNWFDFLHNAILKHDLKSVALMVDNFDSRFFLPRGLREDCFHGGSRNNQPCLLNCAYNELEKSGKQNKTCIQIAQKLLLEFGSNKVFKMVRRNISSEKKRKKNWTPLFVAACVGDADTVISWLSPEGLNENGESIKPLCGEIRRLREATYNISKEQQYIHRPFNKIGCGMASHFMALGATMKWELPLAKIGRHEAV